ncbi:MAG: HyaD/HybD family hydrogenase maturation endopeptidase [Burkholderiales bacterium]
MAPRDALRHDRPRRVVVLGIGNAILSDEGVGVHAVRALAERYELPDGVDAIDGGTAGMELFDALADTDVVVVIDAVKAKREPGSLVCLAGREVPVFFRSKLSPHQVSICDVLASLEFAGSAPADLVLVGVEPGSFELGTELTSEVAGRVPDLLARVVDELAARGVRLSPRAGAGR